MKKINNLQKISKLEKEVYRLNNVLKGYKKAIRSVRSERDFWKQKQLGIYKEIA